MTCGWCHREPDQHSLSTSGPTRCQYQTHRANCPGNFSTKCSDQLIEGAAAVPEVVNGSGTEIKDEKDETIRQLEQELAKLRVSGAPPPSTPLGPSLPPAASSGTASPHQSWGQATPGTLGADIERLARDHLSTNQQFLQAGPSQHGSYSGPLMSEIRKDPNVQLQADAILDALKQTIPVFTNPNASNLAGINPLTAQSTPRTTPGTAPAAATPASNTAVPSASPGLPTSTMQTPSQDNLQLLMQALLAQTPRPNHNGQLGLGAAGTGTPGNQLGSGFNQLGVAGGQLGVGQLGTAGYVGMNTLPQHQPQHPHVLQQQLLSLLQPQPWQGYVHPAQPPQAPQIPPNLLSALSQLPPDAAAAALNNLQQSTLLMPNAPQVQNPGLSLPVLGNQAQLPHQILGPPLHHSYVLGSQPPHHGLPQHPLHQGLLQYGQAQPPQAPQKPSPASSQGMSSMTGVTHVRPTEFSKHCQVEYAKKVKADSCNAILFTWGYVAQILLSRQGLITRMTDQEENGRLQHLLHVMELCAMQSSSTDFNSQAWLCARNYSDRVFQDLDSGATSWPMIGPKMHPTNLMQAMSSFPKIPYKEKKATLKDEINPSQQPLCSKWSTCTTEDKCQYEVDTGRQCNRSHHCAFCMKNFSQARRHKESDCRKKEAANTSSGGNQPS